MAADGNRGQRAQEGDKPLVLRQVESPAEKKRRATISFCRAVIIREARRFRRALAGAGKGLRISIVGLAISGLGSRVTGGGRRLREEQKGRRRVDGGLDGCRRGERPRTRLLVIFFGRHGFEGGDRCGVEAWLRRPSLEATQAYGLVVLQR